MERCLGCMNEYDASFDVCPHCGYVKGTAEQSKNHLAPGTVLINRYLIGRCLGQGGFGITYIAWDQRLYKKVAIKEFMPTSLASRITGQMDITCYNDEAQERFQNGIRRMLDESRRLAQFNDLESVVRVYDCFEANQTAYIIMELLEGENVEMILSRQKKIDLPQVKHIMLPVLLALREIHSAGLIHRDISPDNIVVCKNGKVKLLDFGSARVASGSDEKSLSVILKPGYAPKEQYSSSAKQGPYTDVYAVCATIYRMLTGVKPIDSLERHVQDDKLQPIETLVAVPKDLAHAIGRGLAIEAGNRMQTVDPLLEAFRNMTESSIPARPVKPAKSAKSSKPSKAGKKDKKSKTWVKIVVPVLALLLAGAAVFFVGERKNWWKVPLPVIETATSSYTEAQQSLLEKAVAETVPTALLPSADDRESLEQTYAKSLAYTADAGVLYADYTDADGRLVLHEQILLPQNEVQDFTLYSYTDTGEPKAVAAYDTDGALTSATCYYYDENGSLFVTSEYADGQRVSSTEYRTPSNESEPKLKVMYPDGSEERVEYKNKNGQIEIHKNAAGAKVYERIEYTSPRRIKTVEYDADEEVTRTIIEDLDAEGRTTEYLETGYSDLLVAKYTWTYDAKGRMTSHASYGEKDVQLSRVLFGYSKGKLHSVTKEKTVAKNGEAIREYYYNFSENSYVAYEEHDDRGNPLNIAKYEADGTLVKRTLQEFDEDDRVSRAEYHDEKDETNEVRDDYFYDTYYRPAHCDLFFENPVTGYTAYDADGKKTYTVVEADEGKTVFEERREFDTQGRETYYAVKDQDQFVCEILYDYSSDGQKQTNKDYEDGKLTSKVVCAYDNAMNSKYDEEYDSNEVLRLKRVYSGGEVSAVYVYNANKNLTDQYTVEQLVGKRVHHQDGSGRNLGWTVWDREWYTGITWK